MTHSLDTTLSNETNLCIKCSTFCNAGLLTHSWLSVGQQILRRACKDWSTIGTVAVAGGSRGRQ